MGCDCIDKVKQLLKVLLRPEEQLKEAEDKIAEYDEAKDIIDAFLNTKYKEEERFQRRINKITEYEEK